MKELAPRALQKRLNPMKIREILKFSDYICLGLAALLLLLAPTGGSFWIDEAHSAQIALQPGPALWWKALNDVSSDVQMAPYFLQLWGWAKLAGGSEWALRLNNVPWLLLGLGAWFWVLPRQWRRWFALLAGFSPFLFYYGNEIRPYSMLFGASSLMFAFAYECAMRGVDRSRLLWVFLGALLTMGASAASLPWVGVCLLVVLWLSRRQQTPVRELVPMMIFLLPGAALVGLYLWSFAQGDRASSPAPTGIASLLFVPYELLGAAGLGPGRGDLRISGVAAIKDHLPMLGLHAAALGVVLVAALVSIFRKVRLVRFLALLGLVLVPLLAVMLLGLFSGLRTTGRHFTPLLSLLLPVMALGISSASKNKAAASAAVILFVSLGLSCLQIRFAPRHKKDNYREAAQLAKAEIGAGKRVWWVADASGAEYYKLQLGGKDRAIQLFNAVETPEPTADIIILNRTDAYDRQGTVMRVIGDQQFRLRQKLQGFTIWERSSP